MSDTELLSTISTVYVNDHCQLRLHHHPEHITLHITGNTTHCRFNLTATAADKLLPLLDKAATPTEQDRRYTVEQVPRDDTTPKA